MSAPTVQRAAWRIEPGVRLSFGHDARHGHVPVDLVLHLHEQLALAEVRVLVDVLRGVDRRADDAAPVDDLVELGCRVLGREGADDLVQ